MAISSKSNSGEAFAEESLWSEILEPEDIDQDIDLTTWASTCEYDPGVYTSDIRNIVEKRPKRTVNQWKGGYSKQNNRCYNSNQRRNYNSRRR